MLSALTITSCTSSDDVTVNSPGNGDTDVPKIVFNIKTPIGDPLVYQRTRGIQTDEEAAVQELWMFEIDAATDKLAADPVKVIDNGAVATPTDATVTTTGTGGDIVITYTETAARELTSADKEQLARRFVFVANDEPKKTDGTTSFAKNDTYTALVQAIAAKAFQNTTDLAAGSTQSTDDIWNEINSTKVLPMSGDAVAGGSKVIYIEKKDATINTTVELTRAVARIDVVNLTPKLTITGMRLMKSNSRGYLIPQMGVDLKTPSYAYPTTTAGAAHNAEEASNILVSANATKENFYEDASSNKYFTPKLAVDGNVKKNASGEFEGAKQSRAFYIYEGAPASYTDGTSTEEDAMHLQVYGTLFDGVPVYYNIPFTDKYNKAYLPTDPQYTANKPVVIKRNNIYTVEIGDGYKTSATTDVKMSFSVANWVVQNMEEKIDTEIFKYLDDNDAPDVADDEYASTVTDRDAYEKANYVINIPSYSNTSPLKPLKIYVSEDYSNVQIKKVEISKGTGWTSGITADGAPDTYSWLTTTLKADANSNSGKIVELVAAAMPALKDPAERNISFRITYDINDPANPGSTLSSGHTQVFTVRQDKGDALAFENNGTATDDGVYSYEDEMQYITFGNTDNTNTFNIQITDGATTPVIYTISKVEIGSTDVTSGGTENGLTVSFASNKVSLQVADQDLDADELTNTLTITYNDGTRDRTVEFTVIQERGDRTVLTNNRSTSGVSADGDYAPATRTINFTKDANVNAFILGIHNLEITAATVTSTPAWVHTNIINGKLQVKVDAQANEGDPQRTATITITYGDGKTAEIKVEQDEWPTA